MQQSQNGMRTVPIRKRRRKRRNQGPNAFGIFLFFVLVVGLVGGGLYLKKYGPTRQRMPLEEYYGYHFDDEAALIIDDERIMDEETVEEAAEGAEDAGEGSGEDTEGSGEDGSAEAEDEGGSAFAIVSDGRLYIEKESLKDKIDDGYVFDDVEKILRYATESDLVSVPYGETEYTVSGSAEKEDYPIVIEEYDKVYVAADFASKYSDFTYTLSDSPYRALVYNAGFEHSVATAKGKTAVRRLGGPKSKVLTEVKRGDSLSIKEDLGKWSCVVTADGVIGYAQNSKLGKAAPKVQEARLPERVYKHKSMDGRFYLGWQIITFPESNAKISRDLAGGTSPDVMSPTWYKLTDDEGRFADISSAEYVKTCHDKGIQVWPLVSDFENIVDDVSILERASHRDVLVSGIIQAIQKVGADGVCVDFEKVPIEAKDGFAQFIRELSLACEAADLYLSVSDYIPASFNLYYNRSVQNDYADYVIVMAYDEYHKGGGEAGSNSSLPFVKKAVDATLEEVAPERLVLGMPFFCREWIETGGDLISEEHTLLQMPSYLQKRNLTPQWDEDLGQDYAEYTDGDSKHMIWIENERSLAEKLKVMEDKGLAGGAFWAIGFEPASIWNELEKYK